MITTKTKRKLERLEAKKEWEHKAPLRQVSYHILSEVLEFAEFTEDEKQQLTEILDEDSAGYGNGPYSLVTMSFIIGTIHKANECSHSANAMIMKLGRVCELIEEHESQIVIDISSTCFADSRPDDPFMAFASAESIKRSKRALLVRYLLSHGVKREAIPFRLHELRKFTLNHYRVFRDLEFGPMDNKAMDGRN